MAERPRDATQLEALTVTEVTQHVGSSLPRARRGFEHPAAPLERFDQVAPEISSRRRGGGAGGQFVHHDRRQVFEWCEGVVESLELVVGVGIAKTADEQIGIEAILATERCHLITGFEFGSGQGLCAGDEFVAKDHEIEGGLDGFGRGLGAEDFLGGFQLSGRESKCSGYLPAGFGSGHGRAFFWRMYVNKYTYIRQPGQRGSSA